MTSRDLATEVKLVAERLKPGPRLRFDKVAIRFVRHLQLELQEFVPRNRTLVVTVTAPIRQASKTAIDFEAEIRNGRRRLPVDLSATMTIHGNDLQARLLKGTVRGGPAVIGFVHNPESDPEILFALARERLRQSA